MKKTIRENIITKYRKRMKEHPKSKGFITMQLNFVLFFLDAFLFFAHRKWKLAMFFSSFIIFGFSSSFSYAPKEETVEAINLSDQMQVAIESTDVQFAMEEQVEKEEELIWTEYDIESELTQSEIDEIAAQASQHSIDDILLEVEFTRESEEIDSQFYSIDDWRYTLVNKQHPVPDDYEFTLGTITGTMECDERIVSDLLAMLKAAQEDGVSLIICSAFRDYDRQNYLFTTKVTTYMAGGMSYIEAYQKAGTTVTVPGTSEHQLGLAIDFITATYTKLNAGFGDTEAGIWLKDNCADYGFILRYPEGKEYITGISYEPWHFRYVGVSAAKEIMENDITLEEFLEELE